MHFKGVEQVVGFLQDSSHCKLKMQAPTELRVLSACDTDYATTKVGQRSIGGSLTMVGGSLVQWVAI